MAPWTEDQALKNSLVENALYTAMHFSKDLAHTDAITDQFDIPMSGIQLLFAIEEEPLTVGEIAAYMDVHKPNVAPIVNTLEENGYIERKPSTEDRRKTYIALLPKGKETCQSIREVIVEQLISSNSVKSMTEAKSVNQALGTLVKTMKRKRK